MKKKKTRVFILDDNFPKPQEFIDRELYNHALRERDLSYLVDKGDWGVEWNLKQLTTDLLKTDYVESGQLELYGYLTPEICLAQMTRRRQPDVVIYDWEYGHPYVQSEHWLLELLGHAPDTFVFVYTTVRPDVPPHLNKAAFDKFASRFQLLEKGSTDDSVFSSEEFVYQYVVSRISKTNTISVGGVQVRFEENGYLANPGDILFLESVFGRAFLLAQLKKQRGRISTNSVEKIVSAFRGEMLLNRHTGYLVADDYALLGEKGKLLDRISYLDVLQKFGVLKLREAIETGFAKI